MKIEFDLMQVHSAPDAARPLAVALLSTLPPDAAELAILEWRAVQSARDADAADAAVPGEIVTVEIVLPPARAVQDVEAPAESAPSKQASVPGERQPAQMHTMGQAVDPPVCGATTPLADLYPHLSNKTIGSLTRAGFVTLGDLVGKNPQTLLAGVDRFGQKGLTELTAVMEAAGLAFGAADTAPPEPTAAAPEPQEPAVSEEPEEPTAAAPEPPSAPAPDAQPSAAVLEQEGQATLGLTNGHAQPPQEDLPLREFLRKAEHEIGRAKVVEIMQAHGVTKIADVGASEPALRAAINGAMAA